MPTFELSGPDGATYHLDAPDEGSALQAFHSFNGSAPAAQPQPALSEAVTDIPSEIGRVAGGNIDAIKGGFAPPGGKGSQGALDSFLSTGKAVAAIPGLIASPLTGAVRSLIGHPLAQAEHAVGTVINPAVAAKDDPQQMYQSAADSADTAMLAARPAGLGIVKPAMAGARAEYGLVPKEAPAVPPPSAGEVKAAAKADYKSLTDAGNAVAVPPDMLQEVTAGIKDSLNKEGLRPSVANKTHAALDEISTMGGDTPDLTDLIAGKKTLKKIANGADPTERQAAMLALPQIDAKIGEIAPDLLPTLKRADANYASAMQAKAVEGAAAKAQNNALATGSGGNLDNATRQQFRAILNNEKRMRGLTPDEVAAVKEIANGTVGRNAMRLVGKFDPTAGGLGAMLQGGATIATGGLNLPSAVAGFIARRLAEKGTTEAVANLSQMIRARSPLAMGTTLPLAPAAAPSPAVGVLRGATIPNAMAPIFPREKARRQ